MAGDVGIREVPADDPAAWGRAMRLGVAVVRPIRSVSRHLYLGGLVSVGVGTVAHGAGVAIPIADVVGVGTVATLTVLASLPFRDPALRAATELLVNHQVREGAEWKRETGTRMPRGRAATRRWLDERPSAVGRGSLLTVLGRFAEAEAYWNDHPGKTPEEAFGVEVQRETAVLLAGVAPDLPRLKDLWYRLPDTAERRNRRECVAILEAEAGIDAGRDPIAVLAAARSETGSIAPPARVRSMVAMPIGMTLIALSLATVVRVAFPG